MEYSSMARIEARAQDIKVQDQLVVGGHAYDVVETELVEDEGSVNLKLASVQDAPSTQYPYILNVDCDTKFWITRR
jgi:hypothetical protein